MSEERSHLAGPVEAGRLVEALGLNPNRVTKLDIHADAQSLVWVDVTMVLVDEELNEVTEVLREYVLRKRDEAGVAPTLGGATS